MNITSIRLLKSLIMGPKESGALVKILGIKQQRLAQIIENLCKQDYVKKDGKIVRLETNSKTAFLKAVSRIVDIEMLLCKSNATVISCMVEPIRMDHLIQKTGFSAVTVHRAISDLRSIGAITKKGAVVKINDAKKPLILFASLLKAEMDEKYANEGTEIIFVSTSKILKRVPAGKIAKGETTAFSLFSDFDVEYLTVHDYFSEQSYEMDVQDVLIDAVCASKFAGDRLGLLMCIIFYIRHKDKMDIFQLRKKASKLEISEIWLDIESYVRRTGLKNPELFLPWEEFLEKAALYDVLPEKYMLPKPSDLFKEIGDHLESPIVVYLFGGENMRIKKLKQSTKDCDIVVKDKNTYDEMEKILTKKLGYKAVMKREYSDEDGRINPDDIFVHPERSRVDLFTIKVMRDLSLSVDMQKAADLLHYGKLRVGLLRNEHVFVLKAMAGREGDIQDMDALVRKSPDGPQELNHGKFDWDAVWSEILLQERINPVRNFTVALFESISYLENQTGTRAPFMDKLRRRVIDIMLGILLREGCQPVSHIVDLLIGEDITETRIRNRIDSLARVGVIERLQIGKTKHIRLTTGGEFTRPNWKITDQNLRAYLDWRFNQRQKDILNVPDFVGELTGLGFQRIGEIDEIIRNTSDILLQYEKEQTKDHSDIDATKICIGMVFPKIGTIPSSGYFITEFDRYYTIIRKNVPASLLKMLNHLGAQK